MCLRRLCAKQAMGEGKSDPVETGLIGPVATPLSVVLNGGGRHLRGEGGGGATIRVRA